MKRFIVIACTLLSCFVILSLSCGALNAYESMPLYPFGVANGESADTPFYCGILYSRVGLPMTIDWSATSYSDSDGYYLTYDTWYGDMLRGQSFEIVVLFPLTVASTFSMITPVGVQGVTIVQHTSYRFDLTNDNKGLYYLITTDGRRLDVPTLYEDMLYPMIVYHFTITVDNTFTPPVGQHYDANIVFKFHTFGTGTLPDYYSAEVPVPDDPNDFFSSCVQFFSLFTWIFSVPEVKVILSIFVGAFGVCLLCKFVI